MDTEDVENVRKVKFMAREIFGKDVNWARQKVEALCPELRGRVIVTSGLNATVVRGK